MSLYCLIMKRVLYSSKCTEMRIKPQSNDDGFLSHVYLDSMVVEGLSKKSMVYG